MFCFQVGFKRANGLNKNEQQDIDIQISTLRSIGQSMVKAQRHEELYQDENGRTYSPPIGQQDKDAAMFAEELRNAYADVLLLKQTNTKKWEEAKRQLNMSEADLVKTQPITSVCALGDSILAGTDSKTMGDASPDNFAAYLASKTGASLWNLAKANATSAEVLGQARLMGYTDLAIILVGADDVFQKVNSLTFRDNLEKIVDIVKKKAKRVILVGLPDFQQLQAHFNDTLPTSQFFGPIVKNNQNVGKFREFDALIQKTAERNGVDYFPLTQFKFDQADLGADSFHPGPKGHERIAQALEKKLPEIEYRGIAMPFVRSEGDNWDEQFQMLPDDFLNTIFQLQLGIFAFSAPKLGPIMSQVQKEMMEKHLSLEEKTEYVLRYRWNIGPAENPNEEAARQSYLQAEQIVADLYIRNDDITDFIKGMKLSPESFELFESLCKKAAAVYPPCATLANNILADKSVLYGIYLLNPWPDSPYTPNLLRSLGSQPDDAKKYFDKAIRLSPSYKKKVYDELMGYSGRFVNTDPFASRVFKSAAKAYEEPGWKKERETVISSTDTLLTEYRDSVNAKAKRAGQKSPFKVLGDQPSNEWLLGTEAGTKPVVPKKKTGTK